MATRRSTPGSAIPSSFAAAVRRLEDVGEWRRRSVTALAHVATYSWDASAARLLPVLERVAASRRR